ncbi:MAG: aromatic ring-hydroxylating dioxygenase subunit alpha [Porticoccaceae bacterium]|jgi:phenylpropionate dioxygenase-like ring-hydroxylating dioxygenase large terminal subunit|nr:aromatic ring-hydroxylating dioxygenase subunit alpha [Porticoccaceae bacterium]MEA3299746.1 aromatic ring-hydroxylating dioxygenase subunit alpha [Pseudomonadota bacterium]HLS98891.1 aromatic ring-hydroxylating dioxygenase subunit alpha [Porticoccaceae bacterium]
MKAHDKNVILKAMESQLVRDKHPADFPVLPPVPAGRYFDPGFAALEREHIWLKTWLMVGHESEFPTTGAYRVINKLDRSVIITRGKDGELRAFHNSCRHRGSALLVTEQEGSTQRFTCPYHAWGYGLNGDLVVVPDAHDFPCLNKSEMGLVPVRCETWRGLVYLNFDDGAEPLADFMAPMAAQATGFPLENLVVKHRYAVEADCNWKVAFDNFLEIYHVRFCHPQSLAPYLNSQSFVVSLFDNGHSRFATRKQQTDTLFAYTGLRVSDQADPTFNEYTIALPTFPNSFYALDSAGFNYLTFWPLAPGKVLMEGTLFGWPADSEEDKAYWATMRTAVEGILAEDMYLFPGLQKSMESGAIPTLMMGYQERALYWYQEEIDRRIGPERIPEALRVAQVLGGQVQR